VLNAVGEEGVPVREIAEAIGRQLNLPAKSLPAEEFGGMLVPLLSRDMPASSTITQALLGWKPTHPGLIEDIEQGHYFTWPSVAACCPAVAGARTGRERCRRGR
jgi:nucleoside-diphosphate-sugar epimerase